jgi:hypothetical protein
MLKVAFINQTWDSHIMLLVKQIFYLRFNTLLDFTFPFLVYCEISKSFQRCDFRLVKLFLQVKERLFFNSCLALLEVGATRVLLMHLPQSLFVDSSSDCFNFVCCEYHAYRHFVKCFSDFFSCNRLQNKRFCYVKFVIFFCNSCDNAINSLLKKIVVSISTGSPLHIWLIRLSNLMAYKLLPIIHSSI